MKSNYEIWSRDEGEDDKFGRLINVNDIMEGLFFGDERVVKFNSEATQEAVEAAFSAQDDYDDMWDWLIYDTPFGAVSPEYATRDEEGLFWIDGEFCHISDLEPFETSKFVEWWDGHNWVKDYLGENDTVQEVSFDDDDLVGLDTWDGHNYTAGSVGIHHYAVKIDDASVLVKHTSQWQGAYDTAAILSNNEFEEYYTEYEIENPFKSLER